MHLLGFNNKNGLILGSLSPVNPLVNALMVESQDSTWSWEFLNQIMKMYFHQCIAGLSSFVDVKLYLLVSDICTKSGCFLQF